jgi:hypothetical protein
MLFGKPLSPGGGGGPPTEAPFGFGIPQAALAAASFAQPTVQPAQPQGLLFGQPVGRGAAAAGGRGVFGGGSGEAGQTQQAGTSSGRGAQHVFGLFSAAVRTALPLVAFFGNTSVIISCLRQLLEQCMQRPRTTCLGATQGGSRSSLGFDNSAGAQDSLRCSVS